MSEKKPRSEVPRTQQELVELARREGKEYRKTAPTKARPLTQKDFDERGGVIETKEGPVTFEVGDYLAVGVAGEEWPIPQSTMERTKRLVTTEQDEHGVEWGIYENTTTVRAIQIAEPFEVALERGDILHGNAGDYFVYDGVTCWITAKKIFEATYSEEKVTT